MGHPSVTGKFIVGQLFKIVVIGTLSAAFDPLTEDRDFWLRTKRAEILEAVKRERNVNLAKNVIVFLGDGMGQPIVAASRMYKGQSEGKPGEETFLNFERFPHSGVMRTYCVDRQVPDSSCTATAVFTGVNGLYYTVGLDAHGKNSDCEVTQANKDFFPTSIMSHAQDAGKKTGIVTTTRITHATPAATYAHSPFRDWEGDSEMPNEVTNCPDIARQLIEHTPGCSFDVILGGGRRYFLPQNATSGGKRLDGRDLVAEWQANRESAGKDFAYVHNAADLAEAANNRTSAVLGLFANSHMTYEIERKNKATEEPSLTEMTEAAIKLLDNPNGFVLMVEGGRIDHALHDTNAKRAIYELLEFERAVEKALSMTDPSETLILVGADHSHVMTINGYPVRGNPILGIAEIQKEYDLPYTTLMFTNGNAYDYTFNGTHVLWKDVSDLDTQDVDFRQQAATFQPDGYETHGGEDVVYFGKGPWAHLLNGAHDLAYVGHVAQFAACLGQYAEVCPHRPKRGSRRPFNYNMNMARRPKRHAH